MSMRASASKDGNHESPPYLSLWQLSVFLLCVSSPRFDRIASQCVSIGETRNETSAGIQYVLYCTVQCTVCVRVVLNATEQFI